MLARSPAGLHNRRMAAPANPESYKEVILFLATAGVVVPLFLRLKISPVLGFLGAGVLLGPLGLGRLVGEAPWLSWITIADRDEIAHLAEFGVVFLLFMIGIELSWDRLWTLRRLVFGLGSLQVVACAAALGAIAFALGAEPASAAFVGVALGLSSTAIVVPVLASQKRLSSPTGRATFSVLLFQDLAVAPVLFTIGVLGARQSGGLGTAFVLALAQAAAAIVVIVGVGRLALRPLFGLVAATKSTELFMAACLLVVLATGLVAAASGLSMALGAFIAGLLLAETEYRRAIEAMIDPFKGLLLGVFFVSVGMSLDVTQLARNPGAILLGVLVLVGVKAVVVAGLARAFRLARPVAVESALLLGPGGEFAFVILGGAMAAGLVPEALGQPALIATTVSMIAIPGLARIARGFRKRLESRQDEAEAEPPPAPEKGRVIVAGFGRVGQMIGEMLARHNVPYLAIDQNPALVRDERQAGKPVYFGDSANPEFLRRCGIEGARALVVTLDAPGGIEAVVAAARDERPDLTIVARARDARHATALYALGVDDAVPENFEASLQLSEAVLVDIGVPMGLVIASVHERRDEFRKTLKKVDKASGEAGAPQFRARRRTRR
jgi:CPA2 family monovalent cation:H+ antiporter-2